MTLNKILLAALLIVGQQPPSVQEAIDRMRATLDQLQKDATPPEPPKPVIISTPEAFDVAMVAARPGDVLTLASGFVYANAVKVAVAVTIQGETLPDGRVDRAAALPSFRGGMEVTGDDVILRAIEVRHTNPLTDILRVTGKHVLIDRVRVLGDPVKGAKRGIAGNGADLRVLKSYVADCFGPYTGAQDRQAFLAWDTPGPILIDDTYLEGGTESAMFGGSDPSSEANIPSDIIIRNSTLTKNPAWQSQDVSVKNVLELKNARRVLVENNIIENSWAGHGQTGYCIALTPRNQGGTAPYSTVENVVLRNNDIRHCAAGVTILGTDNIKPSQRANHILIDGNRFADIDPKKYTATAAAGSNKVFEVGAGPAFVTISNNTVAGANIGSGLYFYGAPPAESFTFTGNTLPKARYGMVFGDVVGLKAWATYTINGLLQGNVEQ